MASHFKLHPGNLPVVNQRRLRKIVLCGASSICSVNNFGDELLRDIYMQWLTSLAPAAELRLLKFNGFLNKGATWASDFENADALVFIGGGYFGEADHPGMHPVKRWLKSFAWAVRNDRLYGEAFRYADRLQIPHAVIGVEVGPISQPFYRRSVTRIIDSATKCAVRSPESYQFARRYGAKRSDLELCVDTVLSLQRNDLPPQASAQLETLNLAACTDEFRLGIHLSSLGESHWKKRELLAQLVRQTIAQLPRQTPVSLIFIHDQIHHGKHPEAAIRAQDYFAQHFPDMKVVPYQDHWSLVGVIAAMNCVITTKLHVGITARALSVPVLSIPNHQKTPRFFRHINEPSSYIHIGDLTCPVVPNDLCRFLNDWHPGCTLPVDLKSRQLATMAKGMLQDFVDTVENANNVSAQGQFRQPVASGQC